MVHSGLGVPIHFVSRDVPHQDSCKYTGFSTGFVYKSDLYKSVIYWYERECRYFFIYPQMWLME